MSEIDAVKRFEKEFQATCDGYGVVGLLIDDAGSPINAEAAQLAAARVAREFYGTWALPDWWRVVSNAEEGADAIKALINVLRQSVAAPPVAVVIIDRFLPPTSKAGDRPDDWQRRAEKGKEDLSEVRPEFVRFSEQVAELRKHRGVRELGDGREVSSHEPLIHLLFVTAYAPRLDRQTDAAAGRPIAWIHRARLPVFRLRTELERQRGFGARSSGGDEAALCARGARALWYGPRQVWRDVLDCVKETPNEVVLVTGRGMSDTGAIGSPGIPGNEGLYKEALRWALGRTHEAEQPAAREDSGEPSLVKQLGERFKSINPSDPVLALAHHIDEKVGVPSLLLDQLKPSSVALHYHFLDGLRVAVARHDYALTYQHWAAAHLNWWAIVCTNFDHLHERAAGEVRRRHPRTSAGRAPAEPESPPFVAPQSRRIFKVYGGAHESLHVPLRDQEFQWASGDPPSGLRARWGEFSEREELNKARAAPTTMLIVGHSLEDKNVRAILQDLLERHGDTIVKAIWVDLAQKGGNDLASLIGAPRSFRTTHVQTTALGFFHDLLEITLGRSPPPPPAKTSQVTAVTKAIRRKRR